MAREVERGGEGVDTGVGGGGAGEKDDMGNGTETAFYSGARESVERGHRTGWSGAGAGPGRHAKGWMDGERERKRQREGERKYKREGAISEE